jgi:hypothetical protein
VFPAGGYSVYLLLASEALVVDGKAITMSDLEPVCFVSVINSSLASVTEDASLQRAVVCGHGIGV